MVKFGPSGNGNLFNEAGFSSTVDMPKWLSELGLELFEYSFGRGVSIGEAHARKIGELCTQYGIELSVHAPYYVNFASEEAQKVENSYKYVTDSLRAARWFGAKRAVVHMGSLGKMTEEIAFAAVYEKTATLLDIVRAEGLDDMYVCPETMGKSAQVGTVQEIAQLCALGDILLPCVDFGHVNARGGGILVTVDDYKAVFNTLINAIGFERTANMHIHFSHIEYGAKGELRHLTFEDNVFGPYFSPLSEAIIDMKLSPHIICESAGTQAEDALTMKQIYSCMLQGKY